MIKNDNFTASWLQNIDSSAEEVIFAECKSIDYPKGRFIKRVGDPMDGLYYVKSGKIRMGKLSRKGKELLIVDLPQGEWFGFSALFGSGKMLNDIIAQDDTKLLYLSKTSLKPLLTRFPSISLNLISFLSKVLEYYVIKYEDAVFGSLNFRLERTLRQLCKWKRESQLDISQNELAAMLGVTREAIGVSLNKLKSQGIVSVGYRKIEYLAKVDYVDPENNE